MSRFPRARVLRWLGFTLTELLVVMAVIAVLVTITLVSMKLIGRDAQLSLATNSVLVTLENARAMAIQENSYVMVAFRPRQTGPREQTVQMVLARWTRESPVIELTCPTTRRVGVDRYLPVRDAPIRELPEGFKVAGPSYSSNQDNIWETQTELPRAIAGQEAPGFLLGVLYSPDGSVVNNNSEGHSLGAFVDFNDDGNQQWNGSVVQYMNHQSVPAFGCEFFDDYYLQWGEDDEPLVAFVPFIAVFDEQSARQELGDGDWGTFAGRQQDITAFVTAKTDPIYFNRYTGVAMR